jgi:glycosyltransferase involved in cell wall biosynthesis
LAMARRKRIGLTFSYNEEWIAGSYYILNIIHALKLLPSSERPEIVIVSEEKKNFDLVKKDTRYPYLEFFQFPIKKPVYTVLERSLNKIGRAFGEKKLISKKPKKLNIEFVYPFEVENLTFNPLKKVNWVPDFQEVHLAELFSEEERAKRKKYQEEIICKGDCVVFSSRDSQKDFNHLYPKATIQQYVLPFAVTHPNFDTENLQRLLEKYRLPRRYYFAPNQFWAHKNHMVILKAVHELKKKGIEVHVVFSGKENDYRNTDYVKLLKNYIYEENLEKNISFLGFIERTEQLRLMKDAIAIIQPSKFEGWSTVVEDAKLLNKYIILSDINVHREQIEKNFIFFDPTNANDLANIIAGNIKDRPDEMNIDYSIQKKKFANEFLKLIKQYS